MVVAPVFWLGSRAGLLADVSIWLILALLAGAQLVTATAYALWPDADTGGRLFVRVGVELCSIAAVIYAIGWGPTLAIGLLFGAADNIRVSDSRAANPALLWSVVAIGLGQLAIATGLAPTLISEPLVHGLAVLAALGVTFTIQLVGWTTSDKERAEQELRRNEERFRALVQNASDIVAVVNAEGTLVYASPSAGRILGYTDRSMIGRNTFDLVHPDDLERAREALAETLVAPGVKEPVELRLAHADGTWRHIELVANNLLSESTVRGIVLNARDISERREAEVALRQSEERFRALVQHASDIIMVIGADGILRYASPAFERVLGYAPAEAHGMPALEFAHPEDVEGAARALEVIRDTSHEAARAEVRLRHRDGSWLWFDVSITNLLDDPGVEGIVANLRDVTERMRTQRELTQAEERFRSAFDDAPIGMGLADTDGRLFRVNRALAQLLGYRAQDLLGVRIADITHPDDWAANQREMRRLFAGETSGYRLEKRYIHADGHLLWVSVSVSAVRGPDGAPLYMIGQIEDITERKAIAERLEHAAIHDPLTGLPNRVLFVDRLGLALNRAKRRHSGVGVVFLDLDRFKLINDSLGHATGDELLQLLAQRLRGALRPGDTIARFGGDEFVVLCDEVTDTATVLELAGRIAETVARPAMLAQREVFVTASLGVAISGRRDDSAEALLRDADAAMYRAKDDGRARIELFNEFAHTRAVEHLQTDADLYRAIERAELQVHYQPIVDLETGRVTGFEALVRWLHPTRGLVHPSEFIDHAEETGLIVPIGAWVLEEACRQTARWQSRRHGGPPLSISINLSPRQLTEPALAQDLARILQRTGVEPAAVWLELTEGALMRDVESTGNALQKLRAQGVHLAIDDFGTGYSSLGHLKRFPVEALKIDQAFVAGLGRDAEDTTIVGAVINLAHSLRLTAVAEGLETPLQLSELRTMGCDYAQGYLLGTPRPAIDIGDRPADDLSPWHTTTPS